MGFLKKDKPVEKPNKIKIELRFIEPDYLYDANSVKSAVEKPS